MSRSGGIARWMPVWVPVFVFLALALTLMSPGAAAAPTSAPALVVTPTPTFTPTPTPTPTPTSTSPPSLADCDLVIIKKADPTIVRPGDQVVWTIAVTNRGQKACGQTIVVDDIPEYLEIEDVDTTQGTWTQEGQTVTVEIGLVGQDFTATILIYTRVREDTPAPLTIENVAVVDSIDLSAPTSSDPALIDVIAGPGCDPFITKRAEPTEAQPGDEILFTITVTNRGPVELVGVQVIDRVPEHLDILDVDPATARRQGQEVTVDIGSIGPGFTITIRIYARVREDTPALLSIENVALLRTDECSDTRTTSSFTTGPPTLLPESGGSRAWWWLAACLGTCLVAVSLALSRRGTSGFGL